jgi:hypothetical protein
MAANGTRNLLIFGSISHFGSNEDVKNWFLDFFNLCLTVIASKLSLLSVKVSIETHIAPLLKRSGVVYSALNFATPLPPSETACLAKSPGKTTRTAV